MKPERRSLGWATVLLGALALALLGGCDDPMRAGPDPVDTRVDRVELSAPYDGLFQGETMRVAAEPLSEAGTPLPTAPVTWASSDTSVATVDDGLVSARRPGAVTIVASSGDAQGAIGLVVAAEVWAVYALPAGIEALPGRRVPLKVVSRFGSEARVPATYSSSDTTVATVSESGEVTARAPGTALVTIHYLSRRLEVPVLVRAAGFRLTYLGSLGGGDSFALGINQRGQVVGRAATADGTWVGFLWEDGRMREIAYPGAVYTEAVAINDGGVVVGNAGNCLGCWFMPWRWDDGVLTPIQVGESAPSPQVTDINGRGQVAGHTFFSSGSRFQSGRSFVWRDGETRWLGPSAGSTASLARAEGINEDGVVVGRLVSATMGTWGAGWTDTSEFRAAPPPSSGSYASDINDRGQVVGWVYPNFDEQAGIYLWADGAVTYLGPADPANSSPAAINNVGEIVGGTGVSGSVPFLGRDGHFVDLNLLVADPEWTVTAATDINDRGWIVGYGRHRQTGATGALLLTPPE